MSAAAGSPKSRRSLLDDWLDEEDAAPEIELKPFYAEGISQAWGRAGLFPRRAQDQISPEEPARLAQGRRQRAAVSKHQKRADIVAALELLCERFPKCFVLREHRRVPLKIGIRDDIIAIIGDAIDHQLLGNNAAVYTHNPVYRLA